MPRGGRRAGRVGKAYPNRTDLNKAPPSKTYGDRVAQERSMAAMPVAPPPPPAVAAGGLAAAPAPAGGGLAPFNRATDRPGEPLTHGLTGGPGAGPEALSMLNVDPSIEELRAIYLRFPTEEIRELLEDAD